MDEMKMKTILAVQRRHKPPETADRGCPYNFATVDKVTVTSKIAKAMLSGDEDAIEEVVKRFNERGVKGRTILQVAMGGKGKIASRMPKNTDWRGTGMLTVWDGEI